MALLLAMYQKMRLIREKNQCVLEQTKYSSKLSRVQKNIERVNKMFESRKAKLESQAKLMTSNMKSIFQQASGLAINNSAYLNNYQMYMNGGGATNNAFIQQRIQGYMQSGVPFEWVDGDNGKELKRVTDNQAFEDPETLLKLYQSGAITPYAINLNYDKETDKYTWGEEGAENSGSISAADVQKFRMVLQQSSMDYNNANMCLNQANTDLENNVSIWLQQQTAMLEAEQDQALEPLNYQETMWELEKEQAELKLKRIEEELQSYTQLVDNEAKNTAPKFGL